MDASDIERIAEFEHRLAKAQASAVVDLGWGYALLQNDFPYSHFHNRIAVTASASAAEVLVAADDVLGGADRKHRYVSVHDDLIGQALTEDLVAEGFEAETVLNMIYTGPRPDPATHDVQAVSIAVLRPAVIRDWKLDLPDATDEQLGQLADRTSLIDRAADVSRLAIFDGAEIVAHADLYIDSEQHVAQFENLFTHPPARGKGFGESLLREALRRAFDAGSQVSFLTAEIGEWPLDWYARRGFLSADKSHHFTRT